MTLSRNLALVVLVTITLALTACGGGQRTAVNPTPTAPRSAAVAEPTTTAPPESTAPEAAPTDGPIATVAPPALATEAVEPTGLATESPAEQPTQAATEEPAPASTEVPTEVPTAAVAPEPTAQPTEAATEAPTAQPTQVPTEAPTQQPTKAATPPPSGEVGEYSGSVVNDAGRPVASALVYVGDTMVRAAADGKFSFEAEQADELTVMAPGYKKYVAPLNGADVGTVRLEPFVAKGVYVSGVGDLDVRQRFYELLDDTELNAIVINVKTDEGMVWTSQVPLAQEIGASYEDFYLKDFVAEAHKRGVYVIGRFTTFRDGTLPVERPDLAIKSTEGGIWSDNQGHTWSDPGNRKVWEYLGALGEEIAASGIDEIQFDYVRFPVDGDLDSVVYQTPSTRVNRPVTIESFLAYMEQRLRPQKVFISADTYGLTVWSSKEEGTGQLLVPMAKHLDYFSPMIYPDHFAAGTAGFNIPTQHPYEIIYQSVERAKTKLQGMPVLVRPFLSAFRDTQFGEPFGLEQFLAQKKAAEDAGSHGWLFWNAGLSYPDALFRQE